MVIYIYIHIYIYIYIILKNKIGYRAQGDAWRRAASLGLRGTEVVGAERGT